MRNYALYVSFTTFLCQSCIIYPTPDYSNALHGIGFEGFKLDYCLARVYQNIVLYWNFVDNDRVR